MFNQKKYARFLYFLGIPLIAVFPCSYFRKPVSFDGLHTWASLYNGRLSVKAEASNIRKVGMK